MDPQVSAILLAAGSSRRMGRLKQLLPLGNKPVIRHCLDSIISTGIKDIVVVLGRQGEEILKTIGELPLKQIIPPYPPLLKGGRGDYKMEIVFNENPESEMAESVRIGLRAIDTSSSGVLICLSDHPMVSSETLKTLINLHKEDPDKIIIPVYKRKRGHPALFPRTVINEVFANHNLREIANKYSERIRFVDVSDEGIILDMDTMEDYRKISEKTVTD